ncbi:MAG: hypothetical protein IT444_04090 [Phycisphaeraceae bacterium]|nr:hypothetical protein [Phycisphaeraceae bacterium]
MSQTTYHRVDTERLQQKSEATVTAAQAGDAARFGVRWLIVPLSVLLCIAQSILTIYASNVRMMTLTDTLIPTMAFGILFLLVLLGNPLLALSRVKGLVAFLIISVLLALNVTAKMGGLDRFVTFDGFWNGVLTLTVVTLSAGFVLSLLRLIGMRSFNRPELTVLFASMLVTAGISTFGLTEQLIPLIATPANPAVNTPQKGYDQKLFPNMKSELYIQDQSAVEVFRIGVTEDENGHSLRPPRDEEGWFSFIKYFGRVATLVPWKAWIGPLSYWLVFVIGCYALFYCLTYVVLGYWSQREKLIFPLARLPESLLPDEQGKYTIPGMMRGAGFWLGFAVSFLVLAWNASVSAGWVGAADWALPLGMSRFAFDAKVAGTALEGLGSDIDFGLRFFIMFTAIGIAFLLPLEISFSVWFYCLFGRLIILIAVWMGYGRNGGDFPSNWIWLNNPVTAQGGGALFLFSAISLFKCIRDYVRLSAGRNLADKVRIGLPVIGMAVSLLVVTSWLAWNRIGFGWASLIMLFITLLTVGLMRIVAEGGVYWFQSHTSFFHVYKMTGLGAWLKPALLGPIIPIYSVIFLDTKTFMAPNLLNAASLRADVGASRTKYHTSIVLSIIASVVVSLGFAILLAHVRGANAMHSWFYADGPIYMMDMARDATTDVAQFNPTTTVWWGIGAVWVAASMYLRTWLFWFPHPIGYIMLINPLMAQLWFSFFLGWIVKKVTVRYGGKATFDRVREVFIGLILGELIAIFFWAMLSLALGIKVSGITLNRY